MEVRFQLETPDGHGAPNRACAIMHDGWRLYYQRYHWVTSKKYVGRDTHVQFIPASIPHGLDSIPPHQVTEGRLTYGQFSTFVAAVSQLQPELSSKWRRAVRHSAVGNSSTGKDIGSTISR